MKNGKRLLSLFLSLVMLLALGTAALASEEIQTADMEPSSDAAEGTADLTGGGALLVEENTSLSALILDSESVIDSASEDKTVTLVVNGIQVNTDYDSMLLYASDPDFGGSIQANEDGTITITGDIQLYITDFAQIFAANMGEQIPTTLLLKRHMSAVITIRWSFCSKIYLNMR